MTIAARGHDTVTGFEPLYGDVLPEIDRNLQEIDLWHCFAQLPPEVQTADTDRFGTVIAEDALSLRETGVSHVEIAQTLSELLPHAQQYLTAGACETVSMVDLHPQNAGRLIDLGRRLRLCRFPEEKQKTYPLEVLVDAAEKRYTVIDLRDGGNITFYRSQPPLIRRKGFYGGNDDRARPLTIAQVLEIGENKSSRHLMILYVRCS